MSNKYEAYFKFDWQRGGENFIEEKGVTRCDTYEQAHAIFKAKCKEITQRVFSICDGDYSYVDVSVYVRPEDSISDNIDTFYFTMEGDEENA